MKKIDLPQSPEEVLPEHNEFIATKILGWEKKYNDLKTQWGWFKDGKRIERWVSFWQAFEPYTNIQHSKMLDRILKDNKWRLEIRINSQGECSARVYDIFHQCSSSYSFDDREAFARTDAIVKAFLEMKKNK